MVTKTAQKPKIDDSWLEVLGEEFEKPYFIELKNQIMIDKSRSEIFPPSDQIFSAFNTTPFEDVKVVIIGQDPYHGIHQANGLCFSVSDGIKHPPSLENIFKELSKDLGLPIPKSGNLEPWAKQGVLLLNASLTVRQAAANSHQKYGWQEFTDTVIQQLSDKRTDVVFLLWGGFAKKKGAKIDVEKHHVLTSGHPSPLSANKGHWYGNRHFSKTNEILQRIGKNPINWSIE
ncbi:MAG: uracil-DNA glycosylase [Flavobacteriales bacterium]|nr:uracil-DNA glycosylase [Flavobacteriales bacterium]